MHLWIYFCVIDGYPPPFPEICLPKFLCGKKSTKQYLKGSLDRDQKLRQGPFCDTRSFLCLCNVFTLLKPELVFCCRPSSADLQLLSPETVTIIQPSPHPQTCTAQEMQDTTQISTPVKALLILEMIFQSRIVLRCFHLLRHHRAPAANFSVRLTLVSHLNLSMITIIRTSKVKRDLFR